MEEFGNLSLYDYMDEPFLTQEERIYILEALQVEKVKPLIHIKHSKYNYVFCPFCNADNTRTKSKTFSFTECIECHKTFKNY